VTGAVFSAQKQPPDTENLKKSKGEHAVTTLNKTCTKCGETKPLSEYPRLARSKDGHDYQCKACACARRKAYREANRAKVAAYRKQYRSTDEFRERDAKRIREWREANRDRKAAQNRSYRATAEGRAKQKSSQTRYYRLLAGAKSEPYTREEIFERDGWVCQLCGEPVDSKLFVPDPKSASLDHRVPLSLGGDDTPSNVQLAHFGCNSAKCNRVAQERAS
jgi:5-methylcytosine-specific restriction endonuclease McrA